MAVTLSLTAAASADNKDSQGTDLPWAWVTVARAVCSWVRSVPLRALVLPLARSWEMVSSKAMESVLAVSGARDPHEDYEGALGPQGGGQAPGVRNDLACGPRLCVHPDDAFLQIDDDQGGLRKIESGCRHDAPPRGAPRLD